MSVVAQLLAEEGAAVTGLDSHDGPALNRLRRIGVGVSVGIRVSALNVVNVIVIVLYRRLRLYRRLAMINLKINGTEVSVKEGTTILEAAKQIDVKIPTLCHLNLHEFGMLNEQIYQYHNVSHLTSGVVVESLKCDIFELG